MLEIFRTKRYYVPFLIIIALAVIAMTFFGMSPAPSNKKDTNTIVVATVNGTQITTAEYDSMYRQQLEYYKRMYQGNLTEEALEELDLKQRTLETLIERVLILAQARKDGLTATAADVQQRISSTSAFQVDGKFNKARYFELLQANSLQPAAYEESLKSELVMESMVNRVVESVKVSSEDIRALYEKEHKDVSFDYIKVTSTDFLKTLTYKDDDVKKYYDSHHDSYMVPAKIQAFYAYLDKEEFSKSIKVTNEELKTYYEANKDEMFKEKDTARARHILVRLDGKITDKDKALADARKRAEDVLAGLNKGEDFAELAKKVSEDPGSAKKGGDLGVFSQGAMVKSFDEAVFSMKPGEMSGLIESPFGFHIIKVEEINKGKVSLFNEVRGKVKEALQNEGAMAKARGALQFLKALFEEGGERDKIKSEALRLGVKTRLTKFFSEDKPDKEVMKEKKLANAVLTMNQGGVSLFETRGSMYIVRVEKREDKHVSPFEDVKSSAEEAYKFEQVGELAKKVGEELVEKIKAGEDWNKISAFAREKGYKHGKTEYFSLRRSFGMIPGLSVFVADHDGLFELTKEKPLYEKSVFHGNNAYVFSLSDTNKAPQADFEKIKLSLGRRLTEEKQGEAYKKWTEELRSKAEIKEFKENL